MNIVENLEFFYFSPIMTGRGKPAEETVPIIRRAGDEHREVEGGSFDAHDDGEIDHLSGFSDGESAAAGVSDGFSQAQASAPERCPKDMKETWFLIQLVVWQEGLQHIRLCDKHVAHPPFARKGGCLWTRPGYRRIHAGSRCICKRRLERRLPCMLLTMNSKVKGPSFLLCSFYSF